MTGDVNFSGKISKKIDLKEINAEKTDNSKKEKLDSIFNVNQQESGKDALTVDEIINTVNRIDKNNDGNLSDAELDESWNKLDSEKKQGIEKTEYIAYIKSMAEKNAELAKNDNVGNGYTIQLGEQFDDLVERVLKSNNIDKPTAEQIEAFKKQIIQANKDNGSIKFNSDGSVRWLIPGAKIILPVDTTSGSAKSFIKDKDNKAEVEEEYRKWKKGEIKSFKYVVDEKGSYEVRGDKKTDKNPDVSDVNNEQSADKSKSDKKVNKKVSKTTNVKIADTIYDIADTNSGEVSVTEMKKVIKKNINKDNVVDIWNTYKKRHDDDSSIIDTMASEWLSSKARGDVLASTKHIIVAMLDKAKDLGLTKTEEFSVLKTKLNTLNMRGESWVKGETFTIGLNGKKQMGRLDSEITSFVEKDVNQLAKMISDRTNKDGTSKADNEKTSAKTQETKNSQELGFSKYENELKDKNVPQYYYDTQIAKVIYEIADNESGHKSAMHMKNIIKNYISKDNVIEVWDIYQQQYEADSSIVDTMTSEWLNTEARRDVLTATKHIISAMLDKAKDMGLTKSDAYSVLKFKLHSLNQRGESWVKGETFTTGLNYKKQIGRLDAELTSFVEKDMNNLAKLIYEAER